MKLILIHHGETEEGKKGILLGRLPGTLSKKGKQEIKIVAQKIKKLESKPEIIFSSDLKRAEQSAKIISKILKLKIKYDTLLRERNGGIDEGKKEKEINWKLYEMTSLPYRRHINGENFIEVRNRAKKFLSKIKRSKYKNAIIVSHSAFLSMLLSHIKRWSIKKSIKYNSKNSIIILK